MKIALRLAISAIAFALIATSSHAGEAEMISQMIGRTFNTTLNEAIAPFQAKDAFREVGACGILDVKNIRRYSMKEALKLLSPCLEGLSARYGHTLTARSGIVALDVESKGGLPGIIIETGASPLISPLIRDLNNALAARDRRLFGYPTRILRSGGIHPLSRSAVQDTLDRCFLPAVVTEIKTGADFLGHYGGCIRQDKTLKIMEIRPWQGDDLAIILQSRAPQPVIDGLNGNVTVNAGMGPISVLVIAYPETIYLP